MKQIIVIVPTNGYASMPEVMRNEFMDMVRAYLVDQSSDPMNAPIMVGKDGQPVYVACYWREHVLPTLTTEAIAGLNASLAPMGIKVIECDNPEYALSVEGVTRTTMEDIP